MISLVPSVFLTAINSSSSFRIIAFLPFDLILSNSSLAVLLTNPRFVINVKNDLSLSALTVTTEVIFSSFSNGNKLIIGYPLACLEYSGIS